MQQRPEIVSAIIFSTRYYIRSATGCPTGSHLVGFSRNALKAMTKHFAMIHERDHSHLLGLDTFLDRCRSHGLVRLHKKSIAYQRVHPLVKRR